MAILDGIDVRIISDGTEYTEYADPESEDTGHRLTRYIEIKSGQHFVVQVRLLPDFNFHSANCLSWFLVVDGEPESTSSKFLRDRFERKVRDNQPCVIWNSNEIIYNHRSGLWERCPRVFGDLKIRKPWLHYRVYVD